jgi:hypothetical protein
MILARFRKQPVESRKYVLDYQQRLASGETLTGIEGTDISPISDTTPLAVTSTISDGTQVVLLVSGGEDGIEYKFEVRVNTTDIGVLWEDEVYFLVEEL